MAIDLQSRVCLITGAAQGLGAGIAQGFARRGARVIATDVQAPQHDDAAMNLAWDVTDSSQADEVVKEVVSKFGRIDALVANAGIYPRQEWQEISDEDWSKVIAVNLDGAWNCCRAAAAAMTEQGYGKIVTVSSIEVRLGVAVHAHYDASKAGVIGLTRSLARALGPKGIRVNCLMPGAILTPTELLHFPEQEAVAKICADKQCLPDRLLPEDIEPSFAFLCSEESDAITGQVLCADNGMIHY